jgi:hypothetical protein
MTIEQTLETQSLRITEVLVLIILIISVCYLTITTYSLTEQWEPTTPPPVLAKIATEKVQCKQVVVYKQAAKKSLNLSPTLQADNNEHVLQAAALPISDHPQTCTTILNTETGVSQMLLRQEPLPWFTTEQKGYVGVGYGIIPNQTLGYTISAHEDVVQMKMIHAGPSVSVFSNGTYSAILEVAVHW